MKTELATALAKLLNVKSLVTIALTIGFICQSVAGSLGTEYSNIYLVVISFYFGTQFQKSQEEQEASFFKALQSLYNE